MIKRVQAGSRMSQAVIHGDTIYIAGQVADDRNASLKVQTQQVLSKIDALLKSVGSDKSRLLSVSVFLPHIIDFDAMNRVYDSWIDKTNPPARACVEARLADPGLRIEVAAIAATAE
jgi:enamine deaminase RidA (YjgF/YER057c/UK114 family)